jgi:mRNA interferase MazF
MQNYQQRAVVLLTYPFAELAEAKRRPGLVLLDTGDRDIIVARITSQTTQTIFDIEIVDWQLAGLLIPSVVRLHKVNTLGKKLVDRQLGILSSRDWEQIRHGIRQLWLSMEP